MDFEHAAQRLARDQQNLKGRRTATVSAKAKREADFRKKKQEQVRQQRQQEQKQREFVDRYYKACNRALGVKQLGPTGTGPLLLTATSIWGEGDKIALPPSVLETLTQSQQQQEQQQHDDMSSSPWMFRIGVLKENYKYPSSPLLQAMKPDIESESEDEETSTEAYLDELKQKYVAYTHGTVVEFTQDEGYIGLPAPIADALLSSSSACKIPVQRTQDPSRGTPPMQIDNDHEKTPGHFAYGAFDVPATPLEITLLQLPKGKACTLTPKPEAIRNGFYKLQNIKLVLEQSLIRTRATLSLGDRVQTWHRGVQYDLVVSKVTPSTFQAVTCINTDIEVEFGQVEGCSHGDPKKNDNPKDGGRTLSSSPPPPSTESTATSTIAPIPANGESLLPEPPTDQTEDICTIQIRAEQSGRRRFDINKATLQDLFQFASTLTNNYSTPATNFRLVTRFPRKVYENHSITLKEAGFQAGQELLIVERF